MKKHRNTVLMIFAATVAGAVGGYQYAAPLPKPAAVEAGLSVWFSPTGGCTQAVVSEIKHAQVSIDMQAYSFTSRPIAQALCGAQARGVKVRALIDSKAADDTGSEAGLLAHQGVPTYVDSQHAIAHNKIILIDGKTILTGSFNFTKGAEERNAENLLLIEDKPVLYRAYADNFALHFAHAEVYQPLAK